MFGLCQIEPRAGRLFAMTWIVLGVVLIGVLVMFRYPLFMPNLRKDMTREEIARELQNMRNLGAELDAKKRLGGDQDLWRHVPGAP